MKRGVCLRIECALPARLLQRAVEAGAALASVRVSGRRLTVSCDARSAGIIAKMCRSYGLDCRIIHLDGMSAFIDTLRRRWTLLPAILLAVCICCAVLSRFWLLKVDFTSEGSGDPQAILRCVEAYGFHPGIRRGKLDLDALCKHISAEAGDFSHVGASADGIILRIEAAPETPAPKVLDESAPHDLAAARAGIVHSVFVRAGEACVSPGDTVAPGQILICGEERGSGEERTQVNAQGEVNASIWFEGSASAPLTQEKRIPTGKTRTESELRFFDLSLPLTECDPFGNEIVEMEVLPVVGLFLPLEIRRTTYRELSVRNERCDPKALEEHLRVLARGEAIRRLAAEIETFEIASEWSDAEIIEDTLRVRAVIEAIADIAAPR